MLLPPFIASRVIVEVAVDRSELEEAVVARAQFCYGAPVTPSTLHFFNPTVSSRLSLSSTHIGRIL